MGEFSQRAMYALRRSEECVAIDDFVKGVTQDRLSDLPVNNGIDGIRSSFEQNVYTAFMSATRHAKDHNDPVGVFIDTFADRLKNYDFTHSADQIRQTVHRYEHGNKVAFEQMIAYIFT